MSDMLSRIRQRSQRPTVERDRSLTGQDHPPQDAPQSKPTPPAPTATDLSAQVAALPQIAARRNIRLEVGLDEALLELCDHTGITIETFLEAAYLICDQYPEFQQALLTTAQQRLRRRKEAGKLRRLHSQLQKVSEYQ
ncbi:MAG: hypothetical protein HC838_01850 [Spirulinaceae cyanobacterium RM2_2_10]|nr:hypothetical protein [Spirulinaceae cyanobacterium SM2_1_0]NJO19052.1 hypothetical protein [Spirulinaceae cyanobacterium RM2_2_10]